MKEQGRLTRLLLSERDKSQVTGFMDEIRDIITEFQLSVQLESHNAIKVNRLLASFNAYTHLTLILVYTCRLQVHAFVFVA